MRGRSDIYSAYYENLLSKVCFLKLCGVRPQAVLGCHWADIRGGWVVIGSAETHDNKGLYPKNTPINGKTHSAIENHPASYHSANSPSLAANGREVM